MTQSDMPGKSNHQGDCSSMTCNVMIALAISWLMLYIAEDRDLMQLP